MKQLRIIGLFMILALAGSGIAFAQVLGIGINRITLYQPNQGGGVAFLIEAAGLAPSANRTYALRDMGADRDFLLAGSTLTNGVILYAPSLTPAATPAAVGTTQQTFTVTGLATGDKIFVQGPVATSLCPMTGWRPSAPNTLQLDFTTLTAAACTPASGTYNIFAIR